jgi:hypothetical protein
MGEVVAFRLREKASRRASGPPTGDAQILFFLGVRYSRIEEPPQSCTPDAAGGTGAAAGPTRKRKSRARA